MRNLYHQHPQVLCLCSKTKTIRVMPTNLMIARHNGQHWVMDPDIAAPLDFVLLVQTALMEHTLKWSKCDDLKLLAAVTGKDSAEKLTTMKENRVIEQFADMLRL